MQSFSLTALAALFFVVIVSAAPPHSSSASFQNSLTGNVLTDALERNPDLSEYIYLFECVQDVIDTNVGESSVKLLYKLYILKADVQIMGLLLCYGLEDKGGAEVVTCLFGAAHKIIKLYDEFLDKVFEVNKEIHDKVVDGVNGKCLKMPNFFDADIYRRSFREQLDELIHKQ